MLDFLEEVRDNHSDLKIMLQCYGQAMDDLGPKGVSRRLRAFAAYTDYVLFDAAGGLNAERVREDLPGLLAKYPDLSWDAEGQLHPVNNVRKRPLQLNFTKDYLQASVDVLNQ